MKKPSKPTLTRAQKILLIADWLIAGMRPSQMPTYAAKGGESWSGWNLGADELVDLAGAARRLIDSDVLTDKTAGKKAAILRLEFCYSSSVRINDFKTALAAQKELNRIHGYGSGGDDHEDDETARILELARILEG